MVSVLVSDYPLFILELNNTSTVELAMVNGEDGGPIWTNNLPDVNADINRWFVSDTEFWKHLPSYQGEELAHLLKSSTSLSAGCVLTVLSVQSWWLDKNRPPPAICNKSFTHCIQDNIERVLTIRLFFHRMTAAWKSHGSIVCFGILVWFCFVCCFVANLINSTMWNSNESV